jgi:Periplasmic binding protein
VTPLLETVDAGGKLVRVRKFACVGIAAALSLAAGCASSKSDAGGSSSTTAKSATGPAPGVTADKIKIGVTYVDTNSLKKVNLNFNLGDFKGSYQALANAINAAGGINGRKLELVFAPIDPTGTASADAACLKLTEDEKVFLIVGFFLNDAVVCPNSTHKTAIVGGFMTNERLAKSKAPWVTWNPDDDQPNAVLDELKQRGELDGKVAVVAAAQEKASMDNVVLPKLKSLGITPVETAVIDAPVNDTAALQTNVNLIAEKFKSAGADTVVVVGSSGANWPLYTQDNPYRPKNLFLDIYASRAFATNADTKSTAILKDSLSADSNAPDQARWDEAEMQKCVATLTNGGVDAAAKPPSQFDPDDMSNQPYQATFFSCADMALTKAVLEAAGKNLNYGTLAAAINGLKVTIPGDPAERTYGPPPAADGNPQAYLFAWDEAKKEFVLSNG